MTRCPRIARSGCLTAAVVLALLAAGCLGGRDEEGPAEGEPAATTQDPAGDLFLDVPGDALEPAIDADPGAADAAPSGPAIIDADRCDQGGARLLRLGVGLGGIRAKVCV